MRDLFERFVASAKTGVTRVTGVTGAQNAYGATGLPTAAAVTHGSWRGGNMGNTPPAACGGDAAPAPDTAALDRADVTLSPFQGNKGVTAMGGERPKQDKAISQLLPQLPLLPAEHSTVENFARASSLLDETFGRIAGWWVEGAELPPDTLEGDVDDAVLAGDLEALRTALTVYEQAARERCSAKVVRESGGKWHR